MNYFTMHANHHTALYLKNLTIWNVCLLYLLIGVGTKILSWETLQVIKIC